MRFVAIAIAVASMTALASPSLAQAPPAPPPPAPTPTNPEEPSVDEKRMVAYVATGVSVVSLASGITFGLLAQAEFDCAKDVIACNKNLQNKIVGEELFDVRAEIEQKALAADMSYLFAIASAVVATAGYLAGFVFVDEGATASLPKLEPIRLVSIPPAPRLATRAPATTTTTATTTATATPSTPATEVTR